jgi:hypothetical protein
MSNLKPTALPAGLYHGRRLVATVLSLIPGCQLDAWMSDYAMPERAVAPEEQVWSNVMDPANGRRPYRSRQLPPGRPTSSAWLPRDSTTAPP